MLSLRARDRYPAQNHLQEHRMEINTLLKVVPNKRTIHSCFSNVCMNRYLGAVQTIGTSEIHWEAARFTHMESLLQSGKRSDKHRDYFCV